MPWCAQSVCSGLQSCTQIVRNEWTSGLPVGAMTLAAGHIHYLLFTLIFHCNHCLWRRCGRGRVLQSGNFGDVKRAVRAISPEKPDSVDGRGRQYVRDQLDQIAGIKKSVGEPERDHQRKGQKNGQSISLAQESSD